MNCNKKSRFTPFFALWKYTKFNSGSIFNYVANPYRVHHLQVFERNSLFAWGQNRRRSYLREKIEEIQTSRKTGRKVVGHECLWACKHSCTIMLQDENKTGYLAGYFEPTDDAAEAIVDWCDAHEKSDDGAVPFAEWPQGMRGHFIARIPKFENGVHDE